MSPKLVIPGRGGVSRTRTWNPELFGAVGNSHVEIPGSRKSAPRNDSFNLVADHPWPRGREALGT